MRKPKKEIILEKVLNYYLEIMKKLNFKLRYDGWMLLDVHEEAIQKYLQLSRNIFSSPEISSAIQKYLQLSRNIFSSPEISLKCYI